MTIPALIAIVLVVALYHTICTYWCASGDRFHRHPGAAQINVLLAILWMLAANFLLMV